MSAQLDQMCGVAVTQIVEPDTGVQPRGRDRRFEMAHVEVVVAHVSTLDTRENQVRLVASFDVLLHHLGQICRHGHTTHLVGFRSAYRLILTEVLDHGHLVGIEIPTV
jgi:hypothetical protein